MRRSVDQVSESTEIDHWESQPTWIKVIVKTGIVIELGWYAGWILHMIQIL